MHQFGQGACVIPFRRMFLAAWFWGIIDSMPYHSIMLPSNHIITQSPYDYHEIHVSIPDAPSFRQPEFDIVPRDARSFYQRQLQCVLRDFFPHRACHRSDFLGGRKHNHTCLWSLASPVLGKHNRTLSWLLLFLVLQEHNHTKSWLPLTLQGAFCLSLISCCKDVYCTREERGAQSLDALDISWAWGMPSMSKAVGACGERTDLRKIMMPLTCFEHGSWWYVSPGEPRVANLEYDGLAGSLTVDCIYAQHSKEL